jgi:hypothetical protein
MISGRRGVLLFTAAWLAACGGSGNGAAEPDAPPRAAEGLRMASPRAAHSAVVLADGRVLLIGGCTRESCETGPASATVEAFDPRTGRFGPAGRLTSPRIGAAALRLSDRRVLIAGGWAGSSVSDSLEFFDPTAGTSASAGRLAAARADIAAVTLADGRILLAGGYDGSGPVATVEILDPKDGSVRQAGPLALARTGAAASLLRDGRVLIVGGGASGGGGLVATASAEIFDPATGRSMATGGLRDRRYKHESVALADGSVIVLGGSDERDAGGKLASVERFDPARGAFRPAGALSAPRYKIGGAVVRLPGGKLLVAGGGGRPDLFDPATGRAVAVGPELGGSLNFATATLLPTGAVLIAGGYYERGIRMNDRAWIVAPADMAAP